MLFGFVLSQCHDWKLPRVVHKQQKRLNFAKSVTEIVSPTWSQVVCCCTSDRLIRILTQLHCACVIDKLLFFVHYILLWFVTGEVWHCGMHMWICCRHICLCFFECLFH